MGPVSHGPVILHRISHTFLGFGLYLRGTTVLANTVSNRLLIEGQWDLYLMVR